MSRDGCAWLPNGCLRRYRRRPPKAGVWARLDCPSSAIWRRRWSTCAVTEALSAPWPMPLPSSNRSLAGRSGSGLRRRRPVPGHPRQRDNHRSGGARDTARWIGVGLTAPHTRYRDHRHPPEQIYVVLSDVRWRRASDPWHALASVVCVQSSERRARDALNSTATARDLVPLDRTEQLLILDGCDDAHIAR